MTRVLVTGASGFVGAPLLGRLVAEGHEVHAVSSREPDVAQPAGLTWHRADLLDAGAADRVAAAAGAEQLVHLAWYVAHGRFWSAPENLDWVGASLRLLRAFAAAGGRRALLVGTCAEYAWDHDRDLDERRTALRPGTLYGVSKDALRRVADSFCAEAGLELAWARLFFLYGPREDPARLVPSVIRALLAGERVGTTAGAQVRDFLHVEDVAAALAAVLASDVAGAVNIASGEPVSLAEVLDEIGALTGRPELIDRGARPSPPGEPARIVADVRRLSDEIGFAPKLSLRDGLAATVEWWR